jgi:hypothetical protein
MHPFWITLSDGSLVGCGMVEAREGDTGECRAGCRIGIELDAAAADRSRRVAGA